MGCGAIVMLAAMLSEVQQLEAGIQALEAQRSFLGDAVVDMAIAPIRAKLAALQGAAVPASEPAQALRLVSILFLDVVGSTTLSQYLDPEEISTVMDGSLVRCTTIVRSHGGKVLQYAGDSLLAAFGTDAAREDDAERAVRCGLALLELGRILGAEVLAVYGHIGFNVRVGIHTGSVLLGGGVDEGGSIRGISVNIAARMEQTAPAGGLRISHDTYRQVRGIFSIEPQPPLPIKGVDTPITTYLVQHAKPRAFRVATRGIEGVETRMIGRDTEFHHLQEAFKRLHGEAKFAAVTVVAEAGLGKSRLLFEFDNWAEARPEAFTLFKGRAQPHTEGQPYGLLRDILAWWLQIADDDSMQDAKLKIEQGVAPLFAANDGSDMARSHAHLLGQLIGLDFAESEHVIGIRDDARQIRSRAFHVAAQVFRRVAAQDGAPVMLLLDDLHWADNDSLDFLNHLALIDPDVPMLVVSFTRPTLLERRPKWAGAEATHLRIDLFPLDPDSSRQLASELLKKLSTAQPALREFVTDSAEGNPFYMEELIKMLLDDGAIEISGDHWRAMPDKMQPSRVPQTLTGVLQARLDSLKPAEKLALQQASVIGVVFWDRALAAIDAKAIEELPGVTRRELVIPHQEARLEGVREYAFKHQILHRVTYDTVLKRLRRRYHLKVAGWLAGLSGARANDFLGVTAGHFEIGGDNRRACEFFTRAAEHAAGRFANEAAQAYVSRALKSMGEESDPSFTDKPEFRWRLLDVRLRTLRLQGKRAEEQADLAALHGLADDMHDDRRQSEAALRSCDFALRTSDYRIMESSARQALALAERAGDEQLQLRAQAFLAGALNKLGDAVRGTTLAQAGLAATRSLGLRHIEVGFLKALGAIAERQGDLMATLQIDQQTLLIYRELSDRRGEAMVLGFLGTSRLSLGQLRQAQHDLEKSLQLARAIGDRASETYPLANLSLIARWRGIHATALAHAHAALDAAVASVDRRAEVVALVRLGQAELALGRYGSSAATFDRAHAVTLVLDLVNRYDALAGLAQVALARGDVTEATHHIESLLAYLASGGSLDGTDAQRIRLTCHQVLAHNGDPRAGDLLITAHTELQARAAAITDAELLRSFLNNIPDHREIAVLCAARQRTSGDRVNPK